MRLRWWLLLVLAVSLPGLTGCAKLNEWLEGTVGEEEKTDEETPEEKLANAEKDLQGTDAAKRAAAAAALFGIAIPEDSEVDRWRPTAVGVPLLTDPDDAVVRAVLDGLQTKTGFAEKTEDERQLDPEGYDLQLAEKRLVVEEGLEGLARALQRDDEVIRYRALIVLTNLARPPIVPDDAAEQARTRVAADVLGLALDTAQTTDLRLLAIEALVGYQAGEQIAGLMPLLASPEAELRARVALAVGQAKDWGGAAQGNLAGELVALAKDASQPMDVRWCAAAALGRLAAGEAAELTDPFADPPGLNNLDAYRTFALAHAGAGGEEAAASVNAQVDEVATAAAEELEAERKKGYK